MVRKTVAIKDDLFHSLELNHIMDNYQSFSELVSNALQLLIEKQKKEHYKKAMIEASKDKLYMQDMKSIEDEFQYADFLKESAMTQENIK
jgi:Arc/MetJ-type ribon-helix-helix transcriptional regulator